MWYMSDRNAGWLNPNHHKPLSPSLFPFGCCAFFSLLFSPRFLSNKASALYSSFLITKAEVISLCIPGGGAIRNAFSSQKQEEVFFSTCDYSGSDLHSLSCTSGYPQNIGCDFTINPVIWGLRFLGFIFQEDAGTSGDKTSVIKIQVIV